MFGFPIGNGNAGFNDFVEKFTNNADSGFPKIQQREVFYSIKDGNWEDRTIWQTASGRVGILPTANDDVYIRNNVQTSQSGTPYNCYNLFVTGILNTIQNSVTINVFNNLRCYGSISNSFNLILNVYNNIFCDGAINMPNGNLLYFGENIDKSNYINTFNVGVFSYRRTGNQNIIPLSYTNLQTLNGGIKYICANTTITGGVTIDGGSRLELSVFDFIVNGTTLIQNNSFLSKSEVNGQLLFVGQLQMQGSSFLLDGNPNVEFRGGTYFNNVIAANFVTGTGTWTFSTNNQSSDVRSASLNFNCTILIKSGITLTIACTFGVASHNLTSTINGESGTSKLLMGLNSGLNFTTLASVSSMTTGIFDFTTNANTIGYQGNYSATIPSYFTNFHNLTISGTGTKTLGVNTTLNGNLNINSSGILECSTYNLNILGSTILASSGSLLKSGSGSMLFSGLLTVNFGTILNLSGNPSVESRGGINNNSANFIVGSTNSWTFTTNNQTITTNTGNITFYDAIISGAISVTNLTGVTAIVINNTINGNNASSTLINQGNLYFNSTASSMTTGVFTRTSPTNVIGFIMNANFTIPYTDFQGLRITGTGTKTLSGNTTVGTTLFISSPNLTDVFELSIYNLTVTGITTWQGVISKSGAGAVTFIGALAGSGVNCRMNLSGGNPTVEIRNGMSTTVSSFFDGSGTGTGQWSFTTNSQTIALSNNTNVMNCPILISGAITLTYTGTTHIFKGLINGDNASSKLLMGTGTPSLNYQSATQPMATGILDTSTNLNTWIYGLNAQNIKGGPTTLAKQVYRNLTLNGTGVKTLQGFVSVLNTYTLTAPATLSLNGFTLTNP
jgi:hypothetical protein